MKKGLLLNLKTSQIQKLIIWFPILLSVGIYWTMTRYGIGLTPDSISYIGIADSIKEGKGLLVPYGFPPNLQLTQFPPIYPLIIALFSFLGFPIINSAQLLNFIFLLFFLLISNEILKLINPDIFWTRFALLSFLSFSATSLIIFSMAWSEPLMMTLGLAAFLLLIKNEKKQNKLVMFIVGMLLALAVLTRYAGVTFLGAAFIHTLISRNQNWKHKIINSVLLTAPGLIILTGWLSYNHFSAGNATNRTLSFHMISTSAIQQLLNTISSWFLIPATASTIIKLLSILLVCLIICFSLYSLFLKNTKSSSNSIVTLLLIFIFFYGVFIVFSKLFLDANIPFDFRILSPIFYCLFFLIIMINKLRFPIFTKTKILNYFLPIILILFSVISVSQNLQLIKSSHQNGIGFNQLNWRNSDSLHFLIQQSDATIYISNAPEPVYYYTHRPVYSLPKNYLKMQQSVNNQFEDQMLNLNEYLQNQPTLFIFFDNIPGSSVDEIATISRYFNLVHLGKFEDSNIYCFDPHKESLLCMN